MDDQKSSPNTNDKDTSNELLDQPYDDKQPETYVSPNGEPTAITPMATPLSLQKPKNHSGRWLFRGFVVLLIAVLGAFAYWQWTEAQSANNERASLQSELETVKSANKNVDKEIDTQDVVVDTKTDDELIKIQVDTFLKLIGNNSHVYVASGVKMDDMYAVAKTSLPNSGANPRVIVLEKSAEDWVVVYSSDEPLTSAEKTELTSKFGVTTSLME